MFSYFLPKSAEIQWIEEALELQQAAQEFRLEVERRQAHEDYCKWYYETARQTQAEAIALKDDVDLFSWFWNRRSA